MFEFFPTQLRGIDIDLLALADLNADLAAQLSSNEVAYDPVSEDHPFIQLAYDEINRDALDRILAYANIASANRPLGLPCDFAPLIAHGTDGNEWQLYPLSGLDQHLRAINSETIEMLDGYESLDALLNSLENDGNDITAEEYLVLALTEAIRFCKERNVGLATHW